MKFTMRAPVAAIASKVSDPLHRIREKCHAPFAVAQRQAQHFDAEIVTPGAS
jgi:hypothetical protein